MYTEIIFAASLLIGIYQVWVSVSLFRSADYEPVQKWFQFVLIWAIPLVGAIIVHMVIRSNNEHVKKSGAGYVPPGGEDGSGL